MGSVAPSRFGELPERGSAVTGADAALRPRGAALRPSAGPPTASAACPADRRCRAPSSTSPRSDTNANCGSLRRCSAISPMSWALSGGAITRRIPWRCAASAFSLSPPVGRTCPVSVTSPVPAGGPGTEPLAPIPASHRRSGRRCRLRGQTEGPKTRRPREEEMKVRRQQPVGEVSFRHPVRSDARGKLDAGKRDHGDHEGEWGNAMFRQRSIATRRGFLSTPATYSRCDRGARMWTGYAGCRSDMPARIGAERRLAPPRERATGNQERWPRLALLSC